jgi:hypothetical protein
MENLIFNMAANLWLILDLIFCAALHLRVEWPKTAFINHWPVQDAVYVLRLKTTRNFKLNGKLCFWKTS